jgi:probable rRNA maturation factor
MMRRIPAAPAHLIEIGPPTAAWRRVLPRAGALARTAAAAALRDGLAELPQRHALRTSKTAFELSVVLASDARVRTLNRTYRGKDKPTNVLSFPAGDTGWPVLGDVVIAQGVMRREARSENKTLAAHFSHLVVHGVLHLLGYDHVRDRDAAVMERLESEIMARLGFADPYAPVTRRVKPPR